MKAIDWNAPIEAVHEDGRVVAVKLAPGAQPDSAGHYHLGQADGIALDGRWYFKPDGKSGSWRIRNIHSAAPTYPPALVERMVALVRQMANRPGEGQQLRDIFPEARAIVSELPEVVDADLVEARRIADNHDPESDDCFNAVREALARGRELEKGRAE